MPRTGLAIVLLLLAAAAFAVWTTCAGPDPYSADVAPGGSRAALAGRVASPTSRAASAVPSPAPYAARPRARVAEPRPSAAASETAAATAPDLVDLRIRVLRADGSPAAGATVRCRKKRVEQFFVDSTLEGGAPGARSGPMETDAAGRAVQRVLPRTVQLVDARLGDQVAFDEFRVAESAADLEIRLSPGMSVAGSVRTSDGVPAAGSNVMVQVGPGGRVGVEHEIADDAGRFVAGPFPRGAGAAPEVTVTAEREDLLPGSVVVASGDSTQEVDLTLRPAVALCGRVVDEKGEPVKVTWLLFHDGDYDDEQRMSTDAEGRFTARMAATAHGDMIFVVDEYVVLRISDALRTPGVRDLGDVAVRRGGTIRGTVVRPAGAPAERPHVGVISLDLGVAICEARIGAGATFEGWRIGPGEHVLHVRDGPPDGVGGEWDPVEVRGCFAGTVGLRVVVTDGPGVLVRLHTEGDAADAPPRPFTGVRYEATAGGGTRPYARWKSGEGAIHSLRVPSRTGAEIDVEVMVAGREPWRAKAVHVPEDGTATVVDAFLVPAAPEGGSASPR